ncbi:jg7012 [Pararge aegeria aegeria]|uniref:Jg7012 protein n=1 Tax=Pararge aegeria aegeria TaxID=348720 RepID=A0A8S4QIK5_9NEOP|nr:jg7012 [Pararge aegeria aegeria]
MGLMTGVDKSITPPMTVQKRVFDRLSSSYASVAAVAADKSISVTTSQRAKTREHVVDNWASADVTRGRNSWWPERNCYAK